MSIEDDVALLERVPTLRLLGTAALRMLAIGSEQRNVASGDHLFNALRFGGQIAEIPPDKLRPFPGDRAAIRCWRKQLFNDRPAPFIDKSMSALAAGQLQRGAVGYFPSLGGFKRTLPI